MFSECNLYDFKVFTSCDKQSFVEMKRPKNNGNRIARFNDWKINLINNVCLYYHFLRSDTTTKALVDDPENWVEDDFMIWRDQGRHPNAASYTALLAGSATTTAPPTVPAVISHI